MMGPLLKRTFAIALLLAACGALAKEPIAEDFRCLTSAGQKPIQLEFRTFFDPSSKWTGGYIKYRKSQAVIPLVLKSSEATDQPEGRPWEYEDAWIEVSGGQISGDYEVSHQGARINSFIYRNRKTGAQYGFLEDDNAMGNDGCVWK